MYSRRQRYFAEFIGTAFLLATVVGSGIMAESLANGNTAIALLGNTIATGAILFVLISLLGPISGAHFNPAVSLVFLLRNDLSRQRWYRLCIDAGRWRCCRYVCGSYDV